MDAALHSRNVLSHCMLIGHHSRNVLSHCMLIGHHKVIRQSMPVVNPIIN